MVSVRNIHFRHKDKKDDVLKGISFNAERGSITTILDLMVQGKQRFLNVLRGYGNIIRERFILMETRLINSHSEKEQKYFPYSTGTRTSISILSI